MKTTILIAGLASSAIAWASSPRVEDRHEAMAMRRTAACAESTPLDSSLFWDMALSLATNPSDSSNRQFAEVSMSDSIAYYGTAAQCDTVASRYRAYHVARTGNSNWPLVEVFMIRIGPNRIIANPLVSTEDGGVEFVTLDSSLNVLKVWGVL